MQIITKQQALLSGKTKYFTGKPCKHGHVTERYTASCACLGCLKQSQLDQRALYVKQLQGDVIFSYSLHPADHAAARAFCIALDLQRGRQPPGALPALPDPKKAEPVDIYAIHLNIYGKHVADQLHGRK